MNSNSRNITALLMSAGKVSALIISFIVPMLLVRILPKAEFGVFSQFNTVYLFIASTFVFGFGSNLIYFYNTLEPHKKRAALVQTIIVIGCLTSVSVVTLSFDAINQYFFTSEMLKKYAGLLLCAVVFQMVSSLTDILYVIRQDRAISWLYPLTSITLKAVIVISLILVYKSLDAAIYGVVITLFLMFCFSVGYLGDEIKQLPKGDFLNIKLFKQQIKYALPFGLAVSAKEISGKFDKILAINFLSTTSYASYAVAFTSIPGVLIIYSSLSQVYLMDMVKEYKAGNLGGVVEIYQDLISKSLSFTIPLVVFFFYFADVVIPFLFTKQYSSAIILFRIYLPSMLFLVLGSGVIIRASGKTGFSLKAQLYSLVITMPLTYYLLKNYGVEGAALGAAISTIAPLVILLIFSMKLVSRNIISMFPWKNIFRILMITVVAFIPVYSLSLAIDKSIYLFLYSLPVFGFIVILLEYRFDLLFIEKENVNKLLLRIKGLLHAA